jgi:hypothetical protein
MPPKLLKMPPPAMYCLRLSVALLVALNDMMTNQQLKCPNRPRSLKINRPRGRRRSGPANPFEMTTSPLKLVLMLNLQLKSPNLPRSVVRIRRHRGPHQSGRANPFTSMTSPPKLVPNRVRVKQSQLGALVLVRSGLLNKEASLSLDPILSSRINQMVKIWFPTA